MIGASRGLGSGGGNSDGGAGDGALTRGGSGGGGGGGGGGGASIGSGFGVSTTGGAGGATSRDGAGTGAGTGALIVVSALPSKIISTVVSGSFSSSGFQFGSVMNSARITVTCSTAKEFRPCANAGCATATAAPALSESGKGPLQHRISISRV